MRWPTSGGHGAREFVDRLGLPSYPTGSPASVDLIALAAGEQCELRLTGRVSAEPNGIVRIDSLPPQSGPTVVQQMLQNQLLESADEDPNFDFDADSGLIDGLLQVVDQSGPPWLWPDRLVLLYHPAPEDWDHYVGVLHELPGFFHVDPIQLAPHVLELAERGILGEEADAVSHVIDELAELVSPGR